MEITLRPIDSFDLVTVRGRIDSYTSPDLLDNLNSITKQNRHKIILDLSDVSFVSSAGLRVFIDIQRKCKKSNLGEVMLVNVPARVLDTLELAGFSQLFKFFDDVNSAIQSF